MKIVERGGTGWITALGQHGNLRRFSVEEVECARGSDTAVQHLVVVFRRVTRKR
jgi:hypothetical protein